MFRTYGGLSAGALVVTAVTFVASKLLIVDWLGTQAKSLTELLVYTTFLTWFIFTLFLLTNLVDPAVERSQVLPPLAWHAMAIPAAFVGTKMLSNSPREVLTVLAGVYIAGWILAVVWAGIRRLKATATTQ